MQLATTSFEDGGVIPARYAFAEAHPEAKVTFAGNVNPQLSWTDVPDDTRSFAISAYNIFCIKSNLLSTCSNLLSIFDCIDSNLLST
ncbi:MAG: hypothetical protein U9N56_06190, partial [Actinomycetota bacterium]|nr:hypothetical protein [Actinomycetota bacterium]